MPVVRSRARALISAVVCALAAVSLSVLSPAPALAAPPALLTPASGEHVQEIPRLSWQRQAGAAKYDVQVSVSDTFTSTLVNVSTVNSQYVPVVQLPTGTLWWRARITGSGDTGWATGSFVRDALTGPTVTGPTGVLAQPEQPPVVSWTSINGAAGYTLQISTDSSFSDSAQIAAYDTDNTSLIVPDPQVPNTYYTRVRAQLGNNVVSNWSNPGSYTIAGLATPTLLTPADGAVVTDTVLDWKPVPGAATYQLQVDTNVNFSSPVLNVTVRGTRYSPPGTVDNDQYYWRVRPVDVNGNSKAWPNDPDPRVFQRAWPGQVHLEYPAHGATVGNPFFFQWTPSERTSVNQEDLSLASSYTLQLSKSNTFPVAQTQSCTTVETTLVPQRGGCWPQASGTYYWRVVGHDDFSGANPPTEPAGQEVHQFTYQPGVPTLLSPVEGAPVTIPTLSWSPVPGAARYRVTITETATGDSLVATTAATSYTPRDRLTAGQYSWQVQTVSEDGRLGTVFVFDQGSFVVDSLPAGTAANPNPVDSPSGRRFPTLHWNSVTGADSYEIWAKPHASVAYTLLGDDFGYPAGESFDGTFLQPGDYDWFVKAFAQNGALISATSGPDGTFTINPLEVIPDDQEYAALTGTGLPDDPEQPDLDVSADACRTQILSAGNQSECDNLRNTPVVRWAAGANVGYYQLYVSRDKAMTNLVAGPITLTQPIWTPEDQLPDSQAGTAYYYRVLACSYQTCEGLSPAEHSFDKLSRGAVLKPSQHTLVDATAPSSCLDSGDADTLVECENDVTLSWFDFRNSEEQPLLSVPPPNPAGRPFDFDTPLQTPARTEARSYEVQTATDPNFQNVLETNQVDQTTFTSGALTYPEGPVYWRVRAVDGSDNRLAWSDTGEFEKVSPVPVLASPADQQTVRGDLFLQWQPLAFAATYRVEIYKNDDTTGSAANLVLARTVKQPVLSLTSPLAASSQLYTWRVRRIDVSGRSGDWSLWRRFLIDGPAPTLTSPSAGATGVAPSDAVFTWAGVPGAETYRFERRVAGTLTSIEPATTRALSWAPLQAITGGNWEWRVTAIDLGGADLGSSAWRAFSVTDTVVATTPVSISGSGRVGTPLTLTTPEWNFGTDVSTAYQWFRNTTAIGGATSTTYDVTAADLGRNITVKATGTRPGYITGTSQSNVIVGISGSAPVAVTDVAVSGTGKVGSNLTATAPVWDNDAVTTTYQWQRDGANISGQTTTTYAVAAADVGHQLTIKATGTRTGFDPGTSASAPVTGVLGDAPVATTDVSISGPNNRVGTTLTLSAPAWNTTGVTTTYKWFRDAAAITNATGTGYRLVDADVGHTITVQATATKAGYGSGLSTSNAMVAAALDPVVNTAPPTISGVLAARETLHTSTGTWQVTSGVTYGYQWYIDGVAVAKATKDSFVLRTIDAGHSVSVRVTASAAGWAAGSATSSAMPVAKLVSKTTATLDKRRITQKQRGVLTVTVTLAGYDVPLGQIRVKDGSKTLASTALSSGKNGTVRIRLKKLKPGKHKLKITYLGSAATSGSVAKTVTLKVIRA